MMKRLIPAALCIISAVVLAFGSYFYILNRADELYNDAAYILTMSDDEMYIGAKELCEKWNSVADDFGALLKHSDADELSECFMRIESYAETENSEELISTLKECIIDLQVIKNGERPNRANIF